MTPTGSAWLAMASYLTLANGAGIERGCGR